jgi:hypothetical protein
MTAYDEADFAKTFLTVVLPLMSEDHILLATSSPKVGGGTYSKLIFSRDSEGNPLMNSIILGEPCDMCKASSNPENCDHKMDEWGTWKKPNKMRRLARIYRELGEEETLRGELHTMSRDDGGSRFDRSLYESIVSTRPAERPTNGLLRTVNKIDAIFIGVDPAGGGKCDYAMTAIGQVNATGKFEVRFFFTNSGVCVCLFVDGCMHVLFFLFLFFFLFFLSTTKPPPPSAR